MAGKMRSVRPKTLATDNWQHATDKIRASVAKSNRETVADCPTD